MNDWYKPNNPKKKHTVLILTIALVLAVLLLAVLLFFILSSGIINKSVQGKNDTVSEQNLPDSFKEYFNSYYTGIKSDDADISIPKYDGEISYTLTITDSKQNNMLLQDLYKTCSPWIVSISASTDGESYKYWGSGIVISADGLILTNTHIVDGCCAAYVQLYDMTKYDVTLIAADAVSDIALLKIKPEKELEYAIFGDSGILEVGDEVAAIGSPLGEQFRNTLTDGIISAIERGISYNGHTMTLLQTNTALNEGNSGGALFNMYGQVIGVTNMKMMSYYSSIEGIGFAIPSATVKTIVSDLLEYGYVQRTSIGITVGSIPENILKHYGLPKGLYISSVVKDSGADEAGIKVGDIIVAVEGNEVSSINDVNKVKDSHNVGDKIQISVYRDGEIIEFSVALSNSK